MPPPSPHEFIVRVPVHSRIGGEQVYWFCARCGAADCADTRREGCARELPLEAVRTVIERKRDMLLGILGGREATNGRTRAAGRKPEGAG